MVYLQIIFFVCIISFALAAISIAPFVPTKKSDLERIRKLAKLEDGEVFFEMGCGDGRVSHYMAAAHPQSQVIGIEFCMPIFLYAKIKQVLHPLPNLSIRFGDGYRQNLEAVDVVYVFWVPESMPSLQRKFEKDLKKWARVLSYVCDMNKWKGKLVKNKPVADVLSIYVHQV